MTVTSLTCVDVLFSGCLNIAFDSSCCYLQGEEISIPFPKHLEGIILAFFEEDEGDPRFFLSGLDLVMSSTSDRQFPTTRIIRGIRDRLIRVQV